MLAPRTKIKYQTLDSGVSLAALTISAVFRQIDHHLRVPIQVTQEERADGLE